MVEFVPEELVIPKGKFETLRYRFSRAPYQRLLFEEMDSGHWRRFAVAGCVQSGKTYCAVVCPLMRHLFEFGENVVMGIPSMDIAGDKWRKEVLPSIRASRFRAFLPLRGKGSREGVSNLESVQFRNGAELKFMSAGGGDEKKSAYTTRVIVITEADKMDTAGEASREADPISQIENRASSYESHEAVVYMECTPSIPGGRIWREYTGGTASRIACPCPHCGEFVTPEKAHFRGYQDSTNEMEAEEKAHFVCPACEKTIDDHQRREMNLAGVLVHKGQTIGKDGKVVGDRPPTYTLGFRWNAFNNLFWSSATIGVKGYKMLHAADNGDDPENAKKEWLQFVWAEPYEPPLPEDETPLNPKVVAQRKDTYQQFLLPADVDWVTVGCDCHKRWIYFLTMAFRHDGRILIPDYGKITVHSDQMMEQKAVPQALQELKEYLEEGYLIEGKTMRRLPDLAGVDTRWLPDAIFGFLPSASIVEGAAPGQTKPVKPQIRFMGTMGYGKSQRNGRGYSSPTKLSQTVRRIGEGYYIERVPHYRNWLTNMNVDHWKLRLQHCLTLGSPEGGGTAPGSITFFNSLERNRHQRLAEHFAAEKLIDGKWEAHGENHWLDCGVISLVMACQLGYKFAPMAEAMKKPASGKSWFAMQKGVKR